MSATRSYLAQIHAQEMLPEAVERDLVGRMRDESLPRQARDRARNRLVQAHLRLVPAIIERRRFGARRGLDYDDLVQAGNEGLLAAADKYALDKGTRFGSYAYYHVLGAISAVVADNISVMSRSMKAKRFLMAYPEIAARFEARHGRAMTEAEIAEVARARYDIDEVGALGAAHEAMSPAVCVDRADGGGHVVACSAPDPEAALLAKEEREILVSRLSGALDALPPRERRMVEERRLSGDTLRPIPLCAPEIAVSRERKRMIEARGLAAIRRSLAACDDLPISDEARAAALAEARAFARTAAARLAARGA